MNTNSGMNNCCVIGLGYIGLPTAALFAKNGLSVLGVDTNEDYLEIKKLMEYKS